MDARTGHDRRASVAWLAAACASLLVTAACARTTATPQAAPRPVPAATLRDASDAKLPPLHGRLAELDFDGAALRGNLLGDSSERTATVYLPPAYARDPARRFPVIYSLGGFPPPPAFERAATIGPVESMISDIDAAIAAGRLSDVIVVHLEGRNALGGSFWTNSPATGRWEDLVADDLVAVVDGHLHTLADRAHRGLYGGSMGGFGALSIAMDRPEVFGTVFAQSPCCLDLVGELAPNPLWRGLLDLTALEPARAMFEAGHPEALQVMALAAAFAPDPQRPPFYGDLPYRAADDTIVPAEPAHSRWVAHMPVARVEHEAAGLASLRGLRIQYGRHDELAHIPLSVPAFDQALTAHGVPHELFADEGGHMDFARFGRDAVPFFARTLEGAAPRPR